MGVTSLGRHIRPACHQALLTRLKLCEQCGSNSCVRVFFIPWGHVDNHAHIWAFVTSMGSHGLNARFWLVETIFAALWLVATCSSLYDYFYGFPCSLGLPTKTLLVSTDQAWNSHGACIHLNHFTLKNHFWLFNIQAEPILRSNTITY